VIASSSFLERKCISASVLNASKQEARLLLCEISIAFLVRVLARYSTIYTTHVRLEEEGEMRMSRPKGVRRVPDALHADVVDYLFEYYGKSIKVVSLKKGTESVYFYHNDIFSNHESDQLHFMIQVRKYFSRYLKKNESKLDDDEKTVLQKLIKILSTHSALISIVKLIPGAVTEKIPEGLFNAAETFFPAENGVVNLLTGELLPPSPEYLFNTKSQILYDPAVECPLWERTISEIMAEDAESLHMIQKVLGSALGGETPEYLYVFLGSGANGKSLVTDILDHILGDLGILLPFSALLRKQAGHIPHDLILLKTKRAGIAAETLSGAVLDDQVVKQIIGTQKSTSRKLFEGFERITNISKVFASMNEIPIVKDRSYGLYRRLILIIFTVSFEGKADKQLFSKLEKESSGILNWLIRGYQLFKSEGLEQTVGMKKMLREHIEISNPVAAFVESMVIQDRTSKVKTADLLRTYRKWEISHPDSMLVSNDLFYKELALLLPSNKGKRSESVYHGVRIISPDQNNGDLT
jgi:P4 family phage/plasmid primase-like protien